MSLSLLCCFFHFYVFMSTEPSFQSGRKREGDSDSVLYNGCMLNDVLLLVVDFNLIPVTVALDVLAQLTSSLNTGNERKRNKKNGNKNANHSEHICLKKLFFISNSASLTRQCYRCVLSFIPFITKWGNLKRMCKYAQQSYLEIKEIYFCYTNPKKIDIF